MTKCCTSLKTGLLRLVSLSVLAFGLLVAPTVVAGANPVAGSHGGHLLPTQSAHVGARTAGPGLNLAEFAVTDESTGVTTTSTNSAVSVEPGCATSATFFCLNLGGGNSFTMTSFDNSPLQEGSSFYSPDLIMTIAVGGQRCGEFQGFVGWDGSVQLDQFAVSQTIDTFAAQITCTNADVSISGTIALNVQNTTPGGGYYLYDNQGNTYGFGNDSYLTYLGNPSFLTLNAPIVSMATTPSGDGYWMTAGDGGVFSYGDAQFYGSTGNIHLNKPVVSMAATGDGGGYWFVASDGGIFSYGDAHFYGSMGGSHLNKPIVGMEATPDDGGYWLIASDGGIFSFGDAAFYGSTGGMHLNQPIVSMTSTTDGGGYWLVASDGGVFAFGDAGFFGSTGNIHLNSPIVGILSTNDDLGYLMVAADGGVFNFGDAPFLGSLGDQGISGVVGAVA